ncbi:DNA alkylation repair protein [Pararhizobium sp.]|uniref:DNA alkylation repair protein n=1 Tax=Pararhizobium sp. TaxID=1977563 RepID=UPI002728BF3D|nr:DNA alkylation repair protein [Pararhizobium sp.]MDO9414919.1 DNA alkylation repair protein [Pararhizobium sp.]
MAEPLKNLLYPGLVATMAEHLQAQHSGFDSASFQARATKDMDSLELMQRAMQIRDALIETLPEDFDTAAAILAAALPQKGRSGLTGWALLPVNHFIAARGLQHFDTAFDLLKQLTPHFTAEFGIRIFLHTDQARALAIIRPWTGDPNHHVRRLASEGTRPRLPWAMRLPQLVVDPQPILPILTALIDDPEDYVRRSVANSLNDIAKDHPDLVADFVNRAMVGATPERRWLLKHASRTLLKQGHRAALANFGFAETAGIIASLAVRTPLVTFGQHADFDLLLSNESDSDAVLMVDYIVHHRKANGLTTPKVFKWKSLTLPAGKSAALSKRHAVRAITTRVYYPGEHRVEIQINGTTVASGTIDLSMP